jgi:hypothetical protein
MRVCSSLQTFVLFLSLRYEGLFIITNFCFIYVFIYQEEIFEMPLTNLIPPLFVLAFRLGYIVRKHVRLRLKDFK